MKANCICDLCGNQQEVILQNQWKENGQVFICKKCDHIRSITKFDIEAADYRAIINRRFRQDEK